ncbi:MAG: adenine phosphoribosyltransferase [Candidatus Bathyarchaeota archaeon]|jgi:adenine phosphoribosyltransferase|nr:adenine phosphoribosyltransferase [Candidatus Bathyarchaeota archaeon]MDD4325822.1 adenine phosphoribosyltransferase [Candidatus Bathyarchaeota archaeon]NLD65594.1 adenine phosphoribosyltransferase [Thermoproteota archaeon]
MNTPKFDLKSKIRRIPEFKGVVFWDITPLLKDKDAFRESIKQLADHYRGKKIDLIVSNEARGFIIGAPLAYELGVGFVPIRKKGKLPYNCIDLTYKKEYEDDTIQIHDDAIIKDQNVLIIDDLLATGGTVKANVELVEKLGGKVVGIGFLIELGYLGGRKILGDKHEVFSLIEFKTTNDV